MARGALRLVYISAMMTIGVLGCQSPTSTSAVLPGPNFAGPVIQQQTVAQIPPPVREAPKQVRAVAPMTGIPSAWIPLASAQHRDWTWIVIHHSATPTGGAVAFDKAHKAKGWDELGYHFVIGNGTDTPDGLIEVGPRWPIQKHGAHAKTPDNQYNEHGIGICLVGNFELGRPSARQMASLQKLVTYLAVTYHIKPTDILGHKMTGKATECPGRYTDISVVRAAVLHQRTALTEIESVPDATSSERAEVPASGDSELMVLAH